MEQAIKKAIEGGWIPLQGRPYWVMETAAVLDPSFWQSLGKAMGWTPQGGTGRSYHDEYNEGGYPSMYDWQIKWHRFIDHLISGKDADSFFNELLN